MVRLPGTIRPVGFLHCNEESYTTFFDTLLARTGKSPVDPKTNVPTIIRKYANRRLYNTGNGQFVTLADLQAMIRRGEEFVVREAKTDRDITVSVLAQIVAEEAAKGNNLLSSDYLRRLLLYYHEGLGEHLSAYLERSMDVFAANQRDLLRHLSSPFDPVGALATFRELGERNAEYFTRLFTPGDHDAPADGAGRAEREAERKTEDSRPSPVAAGRDDIPALRAQLLALQRRLDAIERERG